MISSKRPVTQPSCFFFDSKVEQSLVTMPFQGVLPQYICHEKNLIWSG
jgi:hypothetical protein